MNKKILITLTTVGIISLTGVVGYESGGYVFVDEYLAKKVNADTNNLIENKYLGSVKEGVTPGEVANIKRNIKYIHQDSLRDALLSKNNKILQQASLQANVLKYINNEYGLYQNKENININESTQKTLKGYFGQIPKIKNEPVKSRLLKNGTLLIEAYDITINADKSVNKLYSNLNNLTDKDLAGYYNAKTLAQLSYGSSNKNKLNQKLDEINTKISNYITEHDKKSNDDFKNKLSNIIKNGYFTPNIDTSVRISKVSPANFFALQTFNKNKNLNQLLFFSNGQLMLLTKVDDNNVKSTMTIKVNNSSDLSVPSGLYTNPAGNNAQNITYLSANEIISEYGQQTQSTDEQSSSSSSSSTSSSSSSSSSDNNTDNNITNNVVGNVIRFKNSNGTSMFISDTYTNSKTLLVSKSDMASLENVITQGAAFNASK